MFTSITFLLRAPLVNIAPLHSYCSSSLVSEMLINKFSVKPSRTLFTGVTDFTGVTGFTGTTSFTGSTGRIMWDLPLRMGELLQLSCESWLHRQSRGSRKIL
uniref:Secreted protein n=1 Tax=Lutzomyia longipalpis TaxID=7200 RepID=A0A7G3B3X3_LUTLO